MNRLRTAFRHLAQAEPSVRGALVPLLRKADKWQKLPPGWTDASVQSFWDTLTGDNKHKVTKCIKEMQGKDIDDPGAFCAALADRVLGPEWRSKRATRMTTWDRWAVKAAVRKTSTYTQVSTAALSPVFRRVLAEVRFNKRKISVRPSAVFSMYSAGDDGARGFTAMVDIDTNQYKIEWGAWGGGALGQKPSPVDDVNTPRKPLPDHLVIVQGQIGGRDPYATLICTAATLPRLTGGARLAAMMDNYTSLMDAATSTGDERYGRGQTEIWYTRSSAARDLMMGPALLLRRGLALPDPQNLGATHVLLGHVNENSPLEVFRMMQGEVWSPEGQAHSLVRRIGHTSMMVGDIMVIQGRPLMVDKFGLYDLQKQSKVAFNKFNAPELVSQLLTVLEKEGLKDALNQIKMKRVPELVERAWAQRGKEAARIASPLQATFTHLLDSTRPFIRNWDRFLQDLVTAFSGTQWLPETEITKVSPGKKGYHLEVGKQVGGGWHSPPEYEEAEIQVAQTILVQLTASLPWKILIEYVEDAAHGNLTNPREFHHVLVESFRNRAVVAAWGKILREASVSEFQKHPYWSIVIEDLEDTARDMTDKSWNVRYDIQKLSLTKDTILPHGAGIAVVLDVTAHMEVDSATFDY